MSALNFHKEVLVEHKSNSEHLDFHTKESVENLYKDLINLYEMLIEDLEKGIYTLQRLKEYEKERES